MLILADIVHNKSLNQAIGMLILSPLIRLNTIILQILQGCSSKGTALGDNLSTCIILNTLRSHTFCKRK
ncbi:Uncharacterised protein [Segatella copri]|nr:Uncharacterised protein [Segatella copri]